MEVIDQSKWAIKQEKYYMWELPETKLSADGRRLASIAKYYFYGDESTSHHEQISVLERTSYARPNKLGIEVLQLAKEQDNLTFEAFCEKREATLIETRGLHTFIELEVCFKGWKLLMLDELMQNARTYPDEELDETVASFALIWLKELFGERVFSPTEKMKIGANHCLARLGERYEQISTAPYPLDFAWRMKLLASELPVLASQFRELFLGEIGAVSKGAIGKDLQPSGGRPSNWDLGVFCYWKHHMHRSTYPALNPVWGLGDTAAKDRAQNVSRFLKTQANRLRQSGFDANSTYLTADYIPLNLIDKWSEIKS